MSKRIFILLIILISVSLLIFHGTSSKENFLDSKRVNQSDKILNIINSMSLDEKIGQLVISGFYGTSTDSSIIKLIKEDKISGVILFGRNVSDSSTLQSLNKNLKEVNKSNKLPLFISVDEEGGLVSRMPKELKKLPSNKYIGDLNSESISYKVGEIIGEELSYFGFNMDFAPVLDINSNPNNPVIGDRAFSSNKDVVSNLGTSTMLGLTSKNIISVVKHFPGHGDTSVDSHVKLPLVNNDINRLKSFEFIPFKNAIDKGCDAVMVSHIMLPKIDYKYPATMSSKIVTDILRNDLNFKGLVVSDDMTMGAIVENYSLEDASVQSINAGVDLLLICHNYENTKAVLLALKNAVLNGSISQERLNSALYNIISIKNKYSLFEEKSPSYNIKSINEKIVNLFK
ncbi:MAG: beta-N-acetylhexosaminidase [Clostridium sp.]|uniref:beta-N-acetylhexosaminidase n=1 Tax=Clostridium sp. TaxID=1506 RepID=UPI003F2E8446